MSGRGGESSVQREGSNSVGSLVVWVDCSLTRCIVFRLYVACVSSLFVYFLSLSFSSLFCSFTLSFCSLFFYSQIHLTLITILSHYITFHSPYIFTTITTLPFTSFFHPYILLIHILSFSLSLIITNPLTTPTYKFVVDGDNHMMILIRVLLR